MFHGNKAKIPDKSGWVIIKDKSTLYIHVVWSTKEEAKREYNDLLLPYNRNSEWHKRLTITEWPLKPVKEYKYIPKRKPAKDNTGISEEEEKRRKAISKTLKEFHNKRIKNLIRHGGSKPPYGYRNDKHSLSLKKDWKEHRIVERIVKYYSANIPICGIIQKLKFDGTKNRDGRQFTRNQITRIIARSSLFKTQ
jgi:hypothetical protein